MSRIDYFSSKPDFITQLRKVTKEQGEFGLDVMLRVLVELRVSQINGCVYCTDLHSKEARVLGESHQRLDSLPVWKESPFFDPREKAALAWAESLTLIPQTNASDTDYRAVCHFFSSTEVVELSIVVSLANFWNRMAGGFRRIPETVNLQLSAQ
jgi:AhpD family alkylhydroperoxidase